MCPVTTLAMVITVAIAVLLMLGVVFTDIGLHRVSSVSISEIQHRQMTWSRWRFSVIHFGVIAAGLPHSDGVGHENSKRVLGLIQLGKHIGNNDGQGLDAVRGANRPQTRRSSFTISHTLFASGSSKALASLPLVFSSLT